MDADLERVGRLLAALRETEILPATERRTVEEFQRVWPPRKTGDGAEPGGEQIGPRKGSQRD